MFEKLSIAAVYPEILLAVMAIVIAMVDLFVKCPRRTPTYALSLLTIGVVAYLEAVAATQGQTVYSFGNMVVSDAMGSWLKCFSALAVMVTLVYGRPYAAERDMLRGGELFTLGLFALLGMFVMISGNNFLVLYLGLELLTLSSYAMVALRRDSAVASEAAMKYFVLGAMASGFLLYGLSMLYGATGSLDISTVFKAVASGQIKHQVLVLGLVFVVCGLAFKFGVVPFHMWIPDVYQGAPTAVTLMIGGAPKLAAFAMTIRLLVEGLLPLAVDWQQMLMVLAIASLLIGNLAAVAQTNLKRMLAFSTIAQMGFVLIGLLSGVVNGNTAAAANAYSSSMFYVITYVLTTLATFGIILLLAREGFESEEIADLAGLNQRSQAGSIILAVFAVMMSLIGAFYYLRIVK
ncbi:MAG: NADH-quinone oxidoreductase subunit NuoN, partial [Limnohabitans sp.]